MAGKYLKDTNIAIYYLNNQLPEITASKLDRQVIIFSVITRMELLAWRRANVDELQIIEKFIKRSTVHNLEEPVIIKTIEVRKNYSIKLPDAIIAATALVYDYTLVTRDLSDFKNLKGLKLLNPWK